MTKAVLRRFVDGRRWCPTYLVAAALCVAVTLSACGDGDDNGLGLASQVFVVSGDGGKPRQLTTGSRDHHGLAWSPDSRAIASVTTDIGPVAIADVPMRGGVAIIAADGTDVRDMRPRGIPQRVGWIDRDRLSVTTRSAVVTMTRAGKVLHRRSLGRATNHGAAPTLHAVAPDGRRIATVSDDGAEIDLADGDKHRTLVSLDGEEVREIAWSPNGRKIAFTARRRPPRD